MLNVFTKWKDKITGIVEAKVQLVKLNLIERTSKLFSYFIFSIISIFLVITVLILLGIGLGFYFGELTGSNACGFLITVGIYLLLTGLCFIFRKNIVNAFTGMFISVLTNDEDEDNVTDTPQNDKAV
jgi:hypothetical protein